jgi:hypothetical protein
MPESYIPLPTESDYVAAAELCQEDYDTYGGPWVRMMRDDLYISTPRSMTDDAINGATAEVARRVDDGFYPYYQMTHSFARGMRAGYRMVHLVHKQPVSLHGLLSLFNTSVDVEPQQNGLLLERGSGNLEGIGKTGLEIMGEEAASYVEAWAKDMTPDNRLQELITRGTGAVVLGAYALHVDQNFNFIKTYLENIDITSELDDILASNTGE